MVEKIYRSLVSGDLARLLLVSNPLFLREVADVSLFVLSFVFDSPFRLITVLNEILDKRYFLCPITGSSCYEGVWFHFTVH